MVSSVLAVSPAVSLAWLVHVNDLMSLISMHQLGVLSGVTLDKS